MVSSNHELLLLAAKAAGYDVYGTWGNPHEEFRGLWINGKGWNPLEDDGDALRLAVKLRLQITHYAKQVRTWNGKIGAVYERSVTSRDEATRRAITRAAAEIGKDM